MGKRALALLMGITGNMGFAAGCLLQALQRHSPSLRPDILLYTDGMLPEVDARLLRSMGAELVPYSPPDIQLLPMAVRQFSQLSLARFEGFRLLQYYRTVLWLDVDTAIQDDISPLLGYGPFALGLEDPHFTQTGVTSCASINVDAPVPGLDGQAPNRNSGVLVLQETLPEPLALLHRGLSWLKEHATHCLYPDQAALNMLAQHLGRHKLLAELPYSLFNVHPRNPAAQYAPLVHAFGAYKLWDDGLTRCSFPEWDRDYRRWLSLGGSPWGGRVENENYLEGGAFFMLRRLFDTVAAAQNSLDQQQAELRKERLLRTRLEQALRVCTSDTRL